MIVDRRKKIIYFVISFLSILLIGYIDLITGYDFSLSIFYLMPIILITWYIKPIISIPLAFFSSCFIVFNYWSTGVLSENYFVHIWNALIDLLFFLSIIFIINKLKKSLANEKRIARKDYLTGISNRREFYEKLDYEFYRSKRYNRPITIIYFDCDNFKMVNDQFSHQEGDRLLQSIANNICKNIRQTDFAARLGGDEFTIILTDTDNPLAVLAVQKLHTILLKNISQKWNVTFSIGVITYYILPDSYHEIIKEADALMYKVKNNGKDDVKFKIVNTKNILNKKIEDNNETSIPLVFNKKNIKGTIRC